MLPNTPECFLHVTSIPDAYAKASQAEVSGAHRHPRRSATDNAMAAAGRLPVRLPYFVHFIDIPPNNGQAVRPLPSPARVARAAERLVHWQLPQWYSSRFERKEEVGCRGSLFFSLSVVLTTTFSIADAVFGQFDWRIIDPRSPP